MAIAKETCYVAPVAMTKDRSEVLQGTLDLMVLKTLDALGPLHGYGIARRLEPRPELRDLYDTAYEAYTSLHPAIAPIVRRMSQR